MLSIPAREEQVDNGTTDGEEPNNGTPNKLFTQRPVLLEQANDGVYGHYQVKHPEETEATPAIVGAGGAAGS